MVTPPDFVIAGAAKSGTTALYSYLRSHPQVAMSEKKEPAFWSTDLEGHALDRVLDRAEYLQLWSGAEPAALRGEASTNYLRSEVAVPALLAERPDARFVVLLRNPVEMAAAFHSQLVKTFQEDVGDFERAWRLQPPRRRGLHIPPECRAPTLLQYERVCAVGDQLESFVARVPEPNRLILLHEELRRDTRAVYLRVLEFLGLDDDGRQDFEHVNVNTNLRSPSLAALHRSAPRRLGRLYRPARAAAAAVGIGPSAVVNRLNVQRGPRPPLRPGFRAELVSVFEPQVVKVAAVLDRDLSDWR